MDNLFICKECPKVDGEQNYLSIDDCANPEVPDKSERVCISCMNKIVDSLAESEVGYFPPW